MMFLLCFHRREVLRESYVVSVAMEEKNRRKGQLITCLTTSVFHLPSFMCHGVLFLVSVNMYIYSLLLYAMIKN